MSKVEVIVVGYPKSGNTWLTRLVAELLQCPVAGFWKAPTDHQEIACEGESRVSDFECYKSHHPFEAFSTKPEPADNIHLIHVIRDPRDVAISGSKFFPLEKDYMLFLKRVLHKLSGDIRLYRSLLETIRNLPVDNSLYLRRGHQRIDTMIDALANGNQRIHPWVVPWRNYVTEYLNDGVFYVRYEDMLRTPKEECFRILDHLGVSRTEQEVRSAIQAQAFDRVKQKFLGANDNRKSDFLKSGQAYQWRSKLNKKQKDAFLKFSDLLIRLGYPVE
ncbi:MAG: sulfotransferase domain-containing protein [Cyanobacteria bacterium P01_D01_bin.44]